MMFLDALNDFMKFNKNQLFHVLIKNRTVSSEKRVLRTSSRC